MTVKLEGCDIAAMRAATAPTQEQLQEARERLEALKNKCIDMVLDHIGTIKIFAVDEDGRHPGTIGDLEESFACAREDGLTRFLKTRRIANPDGGYITVKF